MSNDTVFLARSFLINEYADYCIYREQPEKREDQMHTPFWAGNEIDRFCTRHFEQVTGYKLKPGECKRVRINVEEV